MAWMTESPMSKLPPTRFLCFAGYYKRFVPLIFHDRSTQQIEHIPFQDLVCKYFILFISIDQITLFASKTCEYYHTLPLYIWQDMHICLRNLKHSWIEDVQLPLHYFWEGDS